MIQKSSILVVGSLNIDLVTTTPRIPAGGETLTASSFATHPGGKGANQAVACARASTHRHQQNRDVAVFMIGAIGDDAYGSLLLSTLEENGVDGQGVSKVDSTTGVAVILVEESSGENRILITPGANGLVRQDGAVNFLERTRPGLVVLQLEIPVETVLAIMAHARVAGVDVLLNPAPAVALPDEAFSGLSHLVLNETEAAILCGLEAPRANGLDEFLKAAFKSLARKGVRNIIITLGGNGVAFCTPTDPGRADWQRIEACQIEKIVDTTAAGDTFVGYYAVGLAMAKAADSPTVNDLEQIVMRANQAAALTVTRQGAMSSIPFRDEIP